MRTTGRASCRRMGFTVKLIAPQFVKPYVKSNKNDANDAEAICEAMSRPNMRFVAVKTVEQQDIQAVHRVRCRLDQAAHGQRPTRSAAWSPSTAWWRPRNWCTCARAIPVWLEDAENGLSERFRRLLHGLWQDLLALDERVAELDREIASDCQRRSRWPSGCNSCAASGR